MGDGGCPTGSEGESTPTCEQTNIRADEHTNIQTDEQTSRHTNGVSMLYGQTQFFPRKRKPSPPSTLPSFYN